MNGENGPMHTWKLKNAQHRLRELVRLALTREPQRVSNGRDAVVVIAARDYDRLMAAAPRGAPRPAEPKPAGTARTAEEGSGTGWARIEEMRKRYGFDEDGWEYEWDHEQREWIVPEEDRALPA